MTIAYKPRSEAKKLTITKGQTLRQTLATGGLDGQLDTVALYNWGTKEAAEINRALVELVGCEEVKPDPLDSKLDPARGTTKTILKPEPWKVDLAFDKVHTVKVKKRLPATAVAITELTPWFDPASATCTIKVRYEGAAARADKREYEVHATGYFDSAADVNGVLVDKPCGTDALNDPTHTHLVRKAKAAAPGTEDIPWDGSSDATEGILKSPAKIRSRCAPYTVLVRYFKDDTDKDTRLKLDPFYPRWKLTGKARREIIEESLVVTWKLEASPTAKEKLKNGQIAVFDKDGVAFVAPLTKDLLAGGKYDLLKGPVKWDKAKVDPKKLPYRIQIQAHSDADEDNGLALAAMPTQVPAYAYEQVQLIGFNVRNDTTLGGEYLGKYVPSFDIRKRAEVMVQAIDLAHGHADTDRKILKVFVAPEFYWRGKEGAYPVDEISTILPKLRDELDKGKYLDWLFVLGTAIGQLKHEEGGGGQEHGSAIHRVKIVTVKSGTVVSAKVWTVPKNGWVFRKTGGAPATKIAADLLGAGVLDPADGGTTCDITLATTGGFANGDDAEMIEPVMKVADTWPPLLPTKTQIKVVSKQCAEIPVDPATGDVLSVGGEKWKAVSEGITSTITKVVFHPNEGFYWLTLSPGGAYQSNKPLKLVEPVSTEVFNVALIQKGWPAPHMKDGSVRELIVYKETISPIDFLRDKALSWHAKTGENRKIKIHGEDDRPALPTAGSTDLLGANPNVERQGNKAVGSEINASGLGGGSVFTMDGVTFGVEVCLDHGKNRLWNHFNGPNKRAGDPLIQVQLIPSWGMSIGGGDAGKEVTALANGLVFNVDGSRMESVARVWDKVWSCDTHSTKTGAKGTKCNKDGSFVSAGTELFLCPDPSHKDRGFAGGCGTHGRTPCNEPLQQLGTAFAASSTTDVPKSNDPTLFKKEGNVQVFPAKALPDPDVAT